MDYFITYKSINFYKSYYIQEVSEQRNAPELKAGESKLIKPHLRELNNKCKVYDNLLLKENLIYSFSVEITNYLLYSPNIKEN